MASLSKSEWTARMKSDLQAMRELIDSGACTFEQAFEQYRGQWESFGPSDGKAFRFAAELFLLAPTENKDEG